MATEREQATPGVYYLDRDILRNPPHIVARIQEIDRKMQEGEEVSEVSQDLFAPTKNGKKYYNWIALGSPCETVIGNAEERERCNKRSIVALEFDLPFYGDAEVSLVCSLEHLEMEREKIAEALSNQGKTVVVFGINGWGRGEIVT